MLNSWFQQNFINDFLYVVCISLIHYISITDDDDDNDDGSGSDDQA